VPAILLDFNDITVDKFGAGAGWLRRWLHRKLRYRPDTECFRGPSQRSGRTGDDCASSGRDADCSRRSTARNLAPRSGNIEGHGRLCFGDPREWYSRRSGLQGKAIGSDELESASKNAAPSTTMRQTLMILPCLALAFGCVAGGNCFAKTAKNAKSAANNECGEKGPWMACAAADLR